jgi:peptide deformylase
MASLKVARMGHPVLRKPSDPVPLEEIGTPAFQQFCADLLETMYEYEGTGLAAPQVHVSKRVVVLVIDDDTGPMFLVNPVVTPKGKKKLSGYEGCLSVPNMRGKVDRHEHIRVVALDRTGARLVFEAFGWAARVVQHECDHLDGVLYVDRADPKSLAFLPEYRRFGPLIPSDEDEEDEEGDEGEE